MWTTLFSARSITKPRFSQQYVSILFLLTRHKLEEPARSSLQTEESLDIAVIDEFALE